MDRYERLLRALGDEPLPAALIDLEAVDKNVGRLVPPVHDRQKTLRIATKSIRSVPLLRHLVDRGGGAIKGVMSYSAREAHWLSTKGFDDILIAYPTAHEGDVRRVAEANASGATVRLTADDEVHLEVAAKVASAAGVRLPIVVDADIAYRPIGERVPIGVRRSPLHGAKRVADFVERVLRHPDLVFAGLMAYEAHVAGVRDESDAGVLMDAATRAMKRRAVVDIAEQRREIEREIHRRGIAIPLFNGGGTGSIDTSSEDASLTEVAAGSGFLGSHLFDGYRGLDITPAAFFALQVTRRPSPGFVTCHGGGYIASGAAGRDRLPVPVFPPGLALTSLEGAGEVQTPVSVPKGVELPLGSTVLFRHAKAGELAEHFDAYLLVREGKVVGRARTYRGEGFAFA